MLTFCRLESSTEGLARVIALVTGKLCIWLLREIFCSITEKEKSVNHFENIEDVLKFDAFCKNVYWRYRVGVRGGGSGRGYRVGYRVEGGSYELPTYRDISYTHGSHPFLLAPACLYFFHCEILRNALAHFSWFPPPSGLDPASRTLVTHIP